MTDDRKLGGWGLPVPVGARFWWGGRLIHTLKEPATLVGDRQSGEWLPGQEDEWFALMDTYALPQIRRLAPDIDQDSNHLYELQVQTPKGVLEIRLNARGSCGYLYASAWLVEVKEADDV